MTVEEMIAERTVKVTAALDEANDTISLKGGTPSADLHGLSAAIATIPQGGGVSVLPLNVSQNGEYTAPDGIAYSPVTVNVQGGGGEVEIEVTQDCTNANQVAAALSQFIPNYNSNYQTSAIFQSVDSFSSAAVNQVLFVALSAKGTAYVGVWNKKTNATTVYEASSFSAAYTNTIIRAGAKFKMVTLSPIRP